MIDMILGSEICLSDSKKFKAVYEQYFSALKYFAMHYMKDEEVACDILQEAFIKIWEKGDVFENELQLKTYLYRVVRNHCLTSIRNTQRQEKRMEGFVVEEVEEAFVYKMIEAEVYALINDVFEELPNACRNVYMKSLEGKSHKEIAEELHIAVTTIKKHKTHANNYLRGRLKDLMLLMMIC